MPFHKNKIIVSMAFFILLIIAVGVFFIDSLHGIMVKGKQDSLKKVSEQGSAAIQAEIQGNLDALSALADQSVFSAGADLEQRVLALAGEVRERNFDSVEYADRSGRAVSDSGTWLHVAGESYFEKALGGEANTAGRQGEQGTAGEVISAVPVKRDGNVTGVLIGTVGNIGRFQLTNSIVTGETDAIYLLKNDGSVLSGGPSGSFFEQTQPLDRSDDLKRMEADFLSGTPGFGAFRLGGVPVLAAYTAVLGTDGWVFLATADYDRTYAQANQILLLSALLLVVLLIAFLTALFYFFKMKRVSYEAKIRNEEQKKYFSYLDALTNLPNRKGVKRQFASWAESCRRECQNGGALFLDVDNLRSVNNTFGHDSGDKFLCETAARLKKAVGSQDLIGRIGSDEFAILVHGVDTESDLEFLTKKILKIFREPYLINGIIIQLTCSIGALLFRYQGAEHEILFDDVLGRGEFVLNEAKATRKGSYVIFNDDYGNLIDRQLRLERALKFSIDNDELLCYFQPQYDCAGKRVTGFETLARWKSVEFGMISPLQFIPMAEKSGFIKELGRFVIEKTFAFAKSMQGRGLTVSFNASPMELIQANFADYVISRFDYYGLEPKSVAIEITESSLIESFEKVVKKLQILGRHGIKVYLDDFGTGFSSLTYLKNLPIDVVKIDKSFIDEIVTNDVEKDIVRMIIRLARRLNLEVIAEGVETVDQLRCVSEAGCSIVQGYYVSRPIPQEEVPPLLEALAAKPEDPGAAEDSPSLG